MSVEPGVYIHYKGNVYSVIGTATHSETGEQLVVYVAQDKMWVRPLSMFTEYVDARGTRVPRFRRVEDNGEWERELATTTG